MLRNTEILMVKGRNIIVYHKVMADLIQVLVINQDISFSSQTELKKSCKYFFSS